MLHVILILVFLTRRIESSSSSSSTSTSTSINNRRTLLHQPFFPIDSVPPPPPTTTQQPPLIPLPSPSPRHHHHSKLPKQKKPKYPFSSQTPPPYNHRLDDHEHFFPTYTSPPSPPSSHSSPSKSVPTFPANISSISLPPSSSSKPISLKLIAITVSLVSAALIALLAASLLYRRRRHKHIHPKLPRSDSLRLYPSNTATSDKPPPPPPLPPPLPPPPPLRNPSNNSAEFLYLGTLANPPTAADFGSKSITLSNVAGGSSSVLGYQRLGSPELHPLPPLPRHNYSRNAKVGSFNDDEDDVDVEFFSPKASPDGNESSSRIASQAAQGLKIRNRSNSNFKTVPSSDSASPSRTMSSSPSSFKSNTPVDFPPSPQQEGNAPSPSPSSPERISGDTQNSPARVSNFTRQQYVPAPEPPPMPPVGFSETTVVPPSPWSQDPVDGPPVLSPPTRSQNPNPTENLENVMEIQKPKLKALHWDKVKASSSNRAMVWDQLKSSTSFQLNEEMMETLFMAKSTNSTAPKSRMFLPMMNHENRRRLLDPKKSQNIAILLRALNVTIDEVCEGLLEGNIDTLGTELLESLLKMAPTKEEEHNLREFNDASPSKLDPVEKFLKALLDVPFAFKRVDALLYIANFDSEVEYLNRSFETLEAACDELRNSRMFLKLLEAVLKTGNRMNVGTNRGDAHAFKLDTLLKLVDVKGTDGRTTLLHFVVQEIIRAEGSRLSVPNQNPKTEIEIDQQSELRDDVEFRKLGLEVVSGLSGELSSVKKAAAMDSHVLYSEVGKLATGITKIGEVFRLNEELGPSASYKKFTDSMNGFLKKAKNCIIKIQAQESVALSMVKETTEYFHGNSTKEEAHPFRIFMVVRDFLSTLDQVCKEVGKINERTIVSSSRQFQTPLNQSLPAVFPQFHIQGRHQYSSSADEISSSP